MSTKEEWVRVESESELRPGMAVQLSHCAPEIEIIYEVILTDGNEPCSPLRPMCPSRMRLRTSDSDSPTLAWCPWEWIERRALYRLSDLTDDFKTTDATKELVTT